MASRTSVVAARPAPGARSDDGSARSVVTSRPAALLLATTGALVLLGLIMVLSASSVEAFAAYGSSFTFFKKQLLWTCLGAVCLGVFARLDYRRLKGWGYAGLVVVLGLLGAVLVPGIGVVAGGSARWLALGPLSFQPSELAKLVLVLFAADVLSRKPERMLGSLSHTVVPVVPVLGVLALLVIAQPDLGTTLILGFIGMGMLWVAGAPLRYWLPLAATGVVAAAFAAFSEEYRRERVLAFLDPWADPLNTGYHTIQSLIALGSGGFFGVGLGASRQKWMYVPNAHTDFIYAIVGEEMGLLGSLIVLSMFAFLAYLGIRIARSAPDRFGMLAASGIAIWISMQALVNIGAVTATMPITGVPLPLVSFGGSSLVITLASLGILSNIASRGDRFRRPRSSDRRSAEEAGTPARR